MDLADDLRSLLALERVDKDLFRGRNANYGPRRTLFGGQVAAQCLLAAAATVEPGRLPHSFHGYFLRAGRSDLPVILEVDRDRDGRSFSARRVVAVQDGEVIFSMVTSFHVEGEGSRFDDAPRRDTGGHGLRRMEHAPRRATRDADRLLEGRLHRLPVGPLRRLPGR
jgi:acyl-CoA thioesterase-2